MLLFRAQGWSYPQIAVQFNKDHTTVMHHCKKYGVEKGGTAPSIQEFERKLGSVLPPSKYKYQHILDEKINPGHSYSLYLKAEKKTPWH